jgi:hypothetical protein
MIIGGSNIEKVTLKFFQMTTVNNVDEHFESFHSTKCVQIIIFWNQIKISIISFDLSGEQPVANLC